MQTRISRAGPLLITRNSTLARTANTTWRNWLQSTSRASHDRAKTAAPLSITDKHFVGLVWITQGGSSGMLSRAHLVANCAAAIATRKDVITRVYNTLLDTSEQAASIFAAIINDHRAERAVMDRTFGDPEIVTSDVVLPLLEEVRRATAAEVAKQKDEVIKGIKGDFEEERKVKEREGARLAFERDNASAQLATAQGHIRQLEKAEQSRQHHLLQKACRRARAVHVGFVFIAVVFLSGVAFVLQTIFSSGTSAALGTQDSFLNRWLIPGGVAVITGIWFGWDMPDFLFGHLRDRLAQWGFRRLARKYGVEALVAGHACNCKKGALSALK